MLFNNAELGRQINTKNVSKLKILCTYDPKQYTNFETGPIMVDDALIGTTEHNIFARPRQLPPELAHT